MSRTTTTTMSVAYVRTAHSERLQLRVDGRLMALGVSGHTRANRAEADAAAIIAAAAAPRGLHVLSVEMDYGSDHRRNKWTMRAVLGVGSAPVASEVNYFDADNSERLQSERVAARAADAAPAPVAAPARVSAMIDIAYTTRDDAMRAAYATRDAARRAAEHAARADDRACDDAIAAAGAAFSAAFAAACAERDAHAAEHAAETPASAERDAEDAERLATDAEDAGSPDALALRLAAIAAANRSARVAEAHAAYAAEPADCEPDRVAAFERARAEAQGSDAACYAAQDERERWEAETLARRSDGRIY